MSQVVFDGFLRGAAAIVWLIVLVRIIRERGTIERLAFRRQLTAGCLVAVLGVIALGPFLLPVTGPWFVRTLYTATSTGVLIVGVVVAMTKVH